MTNILTDEQRAWIGRVKEINERARAGLSENAFIDATGVRAKIEERERFLSIIDTLTTALEAKRGKVKETIVEVCVIEPSEPFICGWWGAFRYELYEEVTKNLEETFDDFMEGLPERTATVMCNIEHFPGQYGEYGRCEIAPYDMLYHIEPLQVTLYEAGEPSPEPGADHAE